MHPQVQIHSTIFKTTQVEDEKGIINTQIVTALQARRIAQEELNVTLAQEALQLENDIASLEQYEIACKSGIVTTEDFARFMTGTSAEAQAYAVKIKEGTGSTQLSAEQQKKAQSQLNATATASKTATVATKAFSIAVNMLTYALITEFIQLASTAINHYVNRAKYASEAMQEAQKRLMMHRLH